MNAARRGHAMCIMHSILSFSSRPPMAAHSVSSPPVGRGFLLAWVACIADARPVEEYSAFLTAAGIAGIHVEAHDAALTEMVREIKGRLLAIELAGKLGKLNLEGIELEQAKSLARAALEAIRTKRLGYALIAGNHATR